jgi:hypothetical protein
VVTDEGGPSGKFRRGGAGEGFREYSHHRISDPGTPALIPRKIGGWAGGRTPSTDGPRPPRAWLQARISGMSGDSGIVASTPRTLPAP